MLLTKDTIYLDILYYYLQILSSQNPFICKHGLYFETHRTCYCGPERRVFAYPGFLRFEQIVVWPVFDAASNLLLFAIVGVIGGNKIVKLRLAPNLAKLSKLNRINIQKSEAEMNESPAVLNENERGSSSNKVTFDQE